MPDLREQAREITRMQLQQWFDWMDRILDIHRANFVFREAGHSELLEHKLLLKDCVRTSFFIQALIADPDFNEPDLLSRLQTRIRQLQDAFDTFHDATLDDSRAEKILQQVFPG